MNPDDPAREPDETDQLRAAALAAGFGLPESQRGNGILLQSADDFIERMKSSEVTPIGHRRPMRRVGLAGVSIAAATLIAVTVIQPWSSPEAAAGTPTPLGYEFADAQDIAFAPGQDPHAPLLDLSGAAAENGDIPKTGQVQHVVTDNWFAAFDDEADDPSAAVIPTVVETWLSDDGSHRAIERRGEALKADGRGLPNNGDWETFAPTSDDSQPAGSIDANLLSGLPKAGKDLDAALLRMNGCGESSPGPERARCLMNQMDEYTSTYVVPARVSSALWSMLSEQDGLRFLGTVRDRAGREGIGISLTPPDRKNYRFVFIASLETGKLLGIEEILIRSDPKLDLKAPAVTRFTAFLTSEYAAEGANSQPAGELASIAKR